MTARRLTPFALLVAMLAAALGAAFGGASDPLELLDPGPVVRWGLPILGAAQDLAMATTLGALMVGGLLVPETTRSARRAAAATVAAWSGLLWTVCGVVDVVFGYADAAGVAVGSPGFWSGVWTTTWELEALRAPAITTIGAALLTSWAFLKPGRNEQAWAFFLGLLTLWPLALVGHTAGALDHMTAVDSLFVHLLTMSLWVGGLAAILLLWGTLGRSAGVVLARFSKVATWCYVAIAASGVLNATLRVSGLGDLGTRYGLLIVGKTLAFAALGALGLQQRRKVLDALEKSPAAQPPKALAVRLGLTEVMIMGVAVGLATALARTFPPVPSEASADPVIAITGYPTPPPISSVNVFTQWQINWLFLGISVVGVGVYLHWVRRLNKRGDSWPITRTLMWVTGWVLLNVVLSGGAGVYGKVMFSAHMFEHMMLAMVIPILLVRGAGVTLAMRALPARKDKTLGPRELLLASVHSRVMSFVANPMVISAIVFGTLILFYFTAWFEFALRTHTGHVTMIIHFMLSGYLQAWAFVGIDPGPKKHPAPLRLIVLLSAMAFHAFFGVAMMTGTGLLAGDFFNEIALPWVESPLEDQQSAGTIAWGVGEVPTLLLTMLIAWEWLRSDSAESRRADRRADRDGDAELNAYNDYLASLSGRRKD